MSAPVSPSQPSIADELLGNLPLQYEDGPDFCTVTDSTGGAFALTVQPELMQLMELASTQHATLKAALLGMVDMYVQLVESGDAGFWDAEKVPEVIAARAALEAKP